MQKSIVAVLISLVVFAFVAKPVGATSAPSFPSCPNPGGAVIASYGSGIHGIVGRSETYQGQDNVYKENDTQVVQCFCSDTAAGTQTNWWKYGDLSDGELKSLEAQGWVWIPTGAAWGLDDAPYLAMNSDFMCGEAGSGRGGQILGLADTGGLAGMQLYLLFACIFALVGFTIRKSSN